MIVVNDTGVPVIKGVQCSQSDWDSGEFAEFHIGMWADYYSCIHLLSDLRSRNVIAVYKHDSDDTIDSII
jgi:hypothetical protein